MPATTLDSIVFRDIFTTEAMRRVFSDEQRVAVLSRLRGGARAGAGAARASFRPRLREEIERPLPDRKHRFRQAQEADRAHRLSGAAGGAAARRALRRRARRVVPLGRHHPGHHRHRDRAADPRRARRWSRRTCDAIADALGRSRAGATATRRWPGAATCSRRCRSPSATSAPSLLAGHPAAPRSDSRSCARACWSASSAAPPARCRRSAPTG